MTWNIGEEFIKDKKGNLICILFPNINPLYPRLIKKTPEIISLIFEFKEVYESGKKMSKKLFDNFREIVEVSKDYNFTWHIDEHGDLCDVDECKICFFPDKESNDFILIQFVPEILQIIQANTVFTSKDAKQKPLYLGLSKILKRIDEY